MNETMKTILSRRSCRKYKTEQISDSDLEQILLAGTYAASGMGRQAAQIVVVQDEATREQLRKMNAAVMGNPDIDPFYGAPTICVVLANLRELIVWTDDIPALVDGNLILRVWSAVELVLHRNLHHAHSKGMARSARHAPVVLLSGASSSCAGEPCAPCARRSP